jgi:ferredoxin--NADP+ reductase
MTELEPAGSSKILPRAAARACHRRIGCMSVLQAEESMAVVGTEEVLRVRHWNDTLFSFATTRDPALRFENGQFVMIGLEVNGRPLMRAYSIASANHEDHLEFFSIKVQDGPLTSRLQSLTPGQKVLVSRKPTGTLVLRDLKPGKRLYLFSTGTGLAPFLSLVKDPEMYERFEKIILVHGVRRTSELAYEEYLSRTLCADEHIGEEVRAKLIYYPTVTREPYRNRGRLTDLIASGQLFQDIGQPPLNPEEDRAMICGSPSMLADLSALLNDRNFSISPHIGEPGDYLIERAFVEK